ncbi:unnamed protein product [Brassica napus]|uniref:GPN-loop GTPase 3 n=1 Tax=Brassica napus TaxID=3708 RepID=A0A816VSJ0_BRANA|nr:unnamed protein product [Brassica napus]
MSTRRSNYGKSKTNREPVKDAVASRHRRLGNQRDLSYQLIHHLSLREREVDTMRYAQLVIGPAGSGKSTYCSSLNQHCETIRRTMHIVNLDPAAEVFNYPVAMDIRELVSVDVVMEELKCGPNAALIRCMEYLEDSLYNWLDEELENFTDDDYLVFDCPGQIEIFTHVPVLKNFVEHLKKNDFNVCAVYLLDSQFVTDVTKFISGCMVSLSAMIQLELPHVNILSKMDLLQDKSNIEEYLDAEPRTMLAGLDQRMAPQFAKLNKAFIELVEQYSMVRFTPLDLTKERSIQYVLSEIDKCIQFGEDAEVKIRELDEDMDQLEL